MKLLDKLFGRRAADGRDGLHGHGDPTGVPAAEMPAKTSRTPPAEAKARRKAYKRRKAAKAARRRNRR